MIKKYKTSHSINDIDNVIRIWYVEIHSTYLEPDTRKRSLIVEVLLGCLEKRYVL